MKVDLKRFLGICSCGKEHAITVDEIIIESGAVRELSRVAADFLHPVILCDQNTEAAAYPYMEQFFKSYEVAKLQGNAVHADDHFAAAADVAVSKEADLLVAVGAGTIHDLARYTAYQRGIPFVSVPTAASVDGFVSTVAAMTWHGMKKTLPAAAPICVLADTDIFGHAPYRLTASGISDLMGKYTALLDWRVCHVLFGEYFCQAIYDLEMEAVQEVEHVLSRIREGDPQCMEKLMYALILSGLAMQMIGNSRPASGAEHHVSHLWEMSIINAPIDALHGEKVSIGLLLVSEHYEKIRQAIEDGTCRITDRRAYETDLLQQTFGAKGKYEDVLKENDPNLMADIDLASLEAKLPRIAWELQQLPSSANLRKKLAEAGCVTTMEEIGLTEAECAAAMEEIGLTEAECAAAMGEIGVSEPGCAITIEEANMVTAFQSLTLRLCPYVRRRLTLLRLSKLMEFRSGNEK